MCTSTLAQPTNKKRSDVPAAAAAAAAAAAVMSLMVAPNFFRHQELSACIFTSIAQPNSITPHYQPRGMHVSCRVCERIVAGYTSARTEKGVVPCVGIASPIVSRPRHCCYGAYEQKKQWQKSMLMLQVLMCGCLCLICACDIGFNWKWFFIRVEERLKGICIGVNFCSSVAKTLRYLFEIHVN